RELLERLCLYDLTTKRLNWYVDSCESRNTGRPGSGCIHHCASRYVSARGLNSSDLVLHDIDTGHFSFQQNSCAALASTPGKAGHYTVRVDKSVGRTKTASNHIVRD